MHKIFFIIKHNSERIKNKNFRKISKIPLYKIALYKLSKFKVFVDTDSDRIISECKKDTKLRHVYCYKRDKEFVDLEKSQKLSPAPLMIKNFLDTYVTNFKEIIVTSHVTSPFLKTATINRALLKMEKHDSVSSCRLTQDFSYLEGRKVSPINFNPNIIEKTQNLKKIIHLNGAFFIIKKNIFLSNGLKRISKKHFFYNLNFPEYVDIDNYEDLHLARLISKSFK
jgi:N-acylneuraminate cytidylyltransferase